MIERSDDGDIAVLRLTHGPVNAMDLELCQSLIAHFHALVTDSARAVVITGSGSSFSAGVDLRRFLDGGADYVKRFMPALAGSFQAAFELTKPVVAAVNGHAIAGGCVLAATADVTLMTDGKGRMGVPEIKVGVSFPRIALEVLRYAVGEVAARRLMLGAQTYPPAEVKAIGLVDQLVDGDELLTRAVRTARALAEESPADTFAATKTQLRREALERTARYAGDDDTAIQLWSRRATDGWTAAYLEAATRR
ncbi:enoyl-CoA hydratase/isomerase family protein [Pseudonocardia asaccharolytica]|uniref:Enoyl-CoA hydratase n=1 Tax=Pseudonocardia asaccharolytica DSM 44247 = NBRC 16224 TaxID=1123024 RepID=A0A511D6M0_9PSEU|nr:enoyl-CoA hydratase/isomerase family protein [Pseudonocardia asaccharolytica]GEL20436.1 enoyl-CoA hydratase [Pseudonocardia asaccharolytica DSM 44247 = NBRC 16224]